MSAGHLRDRVTFYAPTTATDSLRGQAVTYTTVLVHGLGTLARADDAGDAHRAGPANAAGRAAGHPLA